MAHTNFIVIALVSLVSCVVYTNATTKETCLNQCANQYSTLTSGNMYTLAQRQAIHTQCQATCQALPSASTQTGSTIVYKETCLSQCLTQHNTFTARGQYTPAQRQIILNNCQSTCQGLPSQPSTGTQTVGTVNTKETCLSQCWTQHNTFIARGQYTPDQRQIILNNCQSTCQALPSQPSTGTQTVGTVDTKETCLSQCWTQHNTFIARGQYTPAQRQIILNNCQSTCQALPSQPSTGTQTVGTVNTKESCLNQCSNQYSTFTSRGQHTPAQRQAILKQCQTTCQSLPSQTTTGTIPATGTNPKANCLNSCIYQYNSFVSRGQHTDPQRRTILNQCQQTCNALPTSGTTGTTTTTGTKPTTTKKVTLDECETACEDKKGEMSSRVPFTYSADFVQKVYVACQKTCLDLVAPDTLAAKCVLWASKLREVYAKDQQSTSFLQTLEDRATQACKA